MRRPQSSPREVTVSAGETTRDVFAHVSDLLDRAMGRRPLPNLGNLQPPNQFDACAPPSGNAQGQFVVPFRRSILLPAPLAPSGPEQPMTSFGDASAATLGCVSGRQPNGIALHLALSLEFEQLWNLTALTIGDLSSTMS